MKHDSTVVIEEVLLKLRKTGKQSVSRRAILRTLGKVLKYIVDDVIESLKREGYRITK